MKADYSALPPAKSSHHQFDLFGNGFNGAYIKLQQNQVRDFGIFAQGEALIDVAPTENSMSQLLGWIENCYIIKLLSEVWALLTGQNAGGAALGRVDGADQAAISVDHVIGV